MPKNWPSESKMPTGGYPVWRFQDSPEYQVPLAPLTETQMPPAPGAGHDGSNPPPLAAGLGHSNNAPNPDNYQPPSGPMTMADLRAQGKG